MIKMIKNAFSYDWDLLGKHCGSYINGRLDWINGKPMVYVTWLNVLLYIAGKIFVFIPRTVIVTTHWGWGLFNVLVKIAFGILFVDGVIVRFLWSFTRGKYCRPYIVMVYMFPNLDMKTKVKDDLSWAWFRFLHPGFDRRLQGILHNHTYVKVVNGEEADPDGYNRDMNEAIKEFGVKKDEKGHYYSIFDKKNLIGRYIKNIVAVFLCTVIIFSHIGLVALGIFGIDYGVNYMLNKMETESLEDKFSNKELSEERTKQEENTEIYENFEKGQNINLPIEEPGQVVQEYKGCTVEITAALAQIYISPTDYSHMYEATQGMKFVATGKEYVDETESYWYELYIDDNQINTAWVKAEEMVFLK